MLYQSEILRRVFVLFLAFVLVAGLPAPTFAITILGNNTAAQVQPENVPPTLIIGASEQHELALLTEMSILLLEDAGFEIIHLQTPSAAMDDRNDDDGSDDQQNARESIEQQVIDLQWQYPRDSLVQELNVRIELVPNDPNMAWELAAAVDNKYTNFQWLPPVDFYDANTMIIRPELADDLTTIEDLATYLNSGESELFFCVEESFYEESDGLGALLAHYGIELSNENIGIAEPDQIYEAIAFGLCDLIVGRNIDGHVSYYNLKSLSDSRNFFPMYGPALMTRDDVLEQYPQVNDLLGQLGSYINDATMAQLNARIQLGEDGIPDSGDEGTRRAVAKEFLQELGVLSSGSLVLGTTTAPEQHVVGEFLSQLLEEAGYHTVERRGFSSTEDVRAALEANEIDLYINQIGTALGMRHALDAASWPVQLAKAFQLIQTLDDPSDFVWLDEIALVHRNALLVSSQRSEEGIDSVDTLAKILRSSEGDSWKICIDPTIRSRGYGLLDALQESYGFRFDDADIVDVTASELPLTIRGGGCDFVIGFSVDAALGTDTFVPLDEPHNVVSLFTSTPVTRFGVFDDFPELLNILQQIKKPLSSAEIRSITAQNQMGEDGIANNGDETSLSDLVRRLRLQTDGAATGSIVNEVEEARGVLESEKSTIRLGVEIDSTRYLALQLLRLLLEEEGYKTNVALVAEEPAELRAALENGELDLYIESTETALTTYYDLSPDTFPADLNRAFSLIRSLDKPSGLIWLTPIPFIPDRAVLVDDELTESGIASLGDLERFVGDGESTLQLCIQSELIQAVPGRLGSVESLYGFPINLKELFIIQDSDIVELLGGDKCDIIDAHMAAETYATSSFTAIDTSVDSFTLEGTESSLMAPLVRDEILTKNSELRGQIEEAFLLLDTQLLETIKRAHGMDTTVAIHVAQQEQIAEAARGYLCNRQLLSSCIADIANTEDGFGETSEEASEEEPPASAAEVSLAERQEIEVQGQASDSVEQNGGDETAVAVEAELETEPITQTLGLTETVPLSGTPLLSGTIIISGTDTLSDTAIVSNTVTISSTESISDTEAISGTATFSEPTTATASPPIQPTLPITVPAAYRVNVRASSSTDALIVDVLRRGTQWLATGRTANNTWLQIELDDGRPAWVSANAVLFQSDQVDILPIVDISAGSAVLN